MSVERRKYSVFGEMIVPIYFSTDSNNRQTAIDQVSKMLNQKSVTLLEGDLHTMDGKEHLVIASKCRFNWIDAVAEGEL